VTNHSIGASEWVVEVVSSYGQTFKIDVLACSKKEAEKIALKDEKFPVQVVAIYKK
jgi:hypothetical protein